MIRVKVSQPLINVSVSDQSIDVSNDDIKLVKGDTGAVFTPYVDLESNLSWSNNGGLDNPPTRNIRGASGEAGIEAISNLEIEEIMEA